MGYCRLPVGCSVGWDWFRPIVLHSCGRGMLQDAGAPSKVLSSLHLIQFPNWQVLRTSANQLLLVTSDS